MARKITPQMAVAFVKATITLCVSWPLPKTASRFQVIRFKILRLLLSINATVLVVPVIYTLYRNDYDLSEVTKLGCLLAGFVQIPVQNMQLALQHDRLHDVISEMEYNFEYAEAHEKDIYQQYVDKCVSYYAGSTFIYFTIVIMTSTVTPLVTADQTFPTVTRYPFDVEREPIKSIIFVHQFIVVWQCFSTLSTCNLIGVLIWFTAARFKILSQKFRAVNGVRDIIICTRQHLKLLRYAQDVIIVSRSIILTIIILCTWAFINSGLAIISKSAIVDKMQCVIILILTLMEVFACAWPADHLMDASTDVAQAVYDSLWYNEKVVLQKNVWFILLKSQMPITISVSSFLPAISLNYYASYVSTAFSYLMTMRAVFVEDN